MSLYQARFAHLKEKPIWKPGDTIHRGDLIGKIGETGKCYGVHLHFDLLQKEVKMPYRLRHIADYIYDLSKLMEQYNYFLDDEMFDGEYWITTSFGDPDYDFPEWQFHPGFDIVSKKNLVYWNRSYPGKVKDVNFDAPGYGNYIIITYEV